jgi:hypothetical protein
VVFCAVSIAEFHHRIQDARSHRLTMAQWCEARFFELKNTPKLEKNGQEALHFERRFEVGFLLHQRIDRRRLTSQGMIDCRGWQCSTTAGIGYF